MFEWQDLYTEMVNRFPSGSKFVEVGLLCGRSFAYLATEIVNSGKDIRLTGVDGFFWEAEDSISSFKNFKKNLSPVEGRYEVIRSLSKESASLFADNSLDFVFIDANHAYDAIRDDIMAYLPKMKPDGILGGHDYYAADHPGVVQAVDEIFGDKAHIRHDIHTWWVEMKDVTPPKKRVAVIYAGELRTWEKVKSNQEENLLNLYDCDLFWYTYENPNYRGTFVPITKTRWPPEDTPYHANKIPEAAPDRTLNMWHNLFIAFSLVPDTYDYYVKCRTDIRFDGRIVLENSPGKVYIPNHSDFRDGVNDQFAYGCHKSIRDYVELYLHFKDYYAQGIAFHSEYYLKHHLLTQGIEIVRTPVRQHIVRI
jgi:hypothetical protein